MENDWAKCQLNGDPNFKKLTARNQQECISRGFEFANNFAESFIEKYGADCSFSRLEEIALQVGCKVVLHQRDILCPFLSDFDPNRKIITLYEKNIDRFYEKIHEKFFDCFLSYNLREMCLLHELCHVMEYLEYGEIGRLYFVTKKRLFMERRIYIRRLSEVAAHRFVEVMMHLHHSPALFGVD